MKSNAKTLLKVLVATAILCLFTAVGASAEIKTGTFTDAKLVVPSDANGSYSFEPNNTYTYEFNTETGHLTIDAQKNSDGTYANDGIMMMDLNVAAKDSVTGKAYSSGDEIPKAYIPWYDNTFEDGTKFAKESVKSVTIGPGIHKLGRRLFSRTGITELTIPGTVNSSAADWGVATGCANLETITFEDGVVTIGAKFAYNCPKLKNVYLSRTVSNIHPQAFGGDNAESGGTATIHYYPLTAPLKAMEDFRTTTNTSFIEQNKNLKYETVNKIYSGEFTDDNNNTFTYSLVADFDDATYVWANAPAVTRTLTVDSKTAITDDARYMNIGDASFNKLPQYLNKDNGVTSANQYPWGKDGWKSQVTEVRFGANIINVGRSLCEGMSNLKKVTVPGNVVMAHWGVFQNCTSLETAIFEEGFRNFEQGKNFQNCTSLKDVYIPASMEKMNPLMFDGSTTANNPTSVNLHYWESSKSNDEIIGKYTGKDYIKPIKRTGNLEILTRDSDGTENAIKIDINTDTMVMNISANKDESGNRIGNGKTRTSTDSWSTKNTETGVVTHGERAPYAWLQKSIKEINIGDGIEYVSSSLIITANSLTKVTFGPSVKEINSFAINGSAALETVVLPEGITTLRSGIFNNCTKLIDVTIPKSVKSVGTILRHTSSWQSTPDNAVITAYKGTAGETMLFGMNADKPEKFTSAGQEYRRTESKIINDDGSVVYVLLNPGSTSNLAKEAAEKGYKTATFGVPMVKVADDKASADAAFTGSAAKGILIATKHDANGNMTAVQLLDGVTAKSAGYYTINFDDTFKAADGTVTAMLWEGIDTMKPLCASVSK